MADSKISALTALTSAAAADVLPIVDTSATATKKMTIENIFKNIPVSVGVNEGTPLAKLHVTRDAVNHSTQSSLAPIFVEDDNRPGIFFSGNLNNIGIIQFGDNSSINAGEIFYAHSDDKFSFRCAGTVQATLADGVLAPETDSDVDLGTTSLRFKDTFVDSITVTGEIDGASLDIEGNADINGTTNLDVVDIDGAVNMATTALVTGVLTTTAATVFNGGFASNADSTMGTDKKIQFRDAAIHISSSADGQLDLVADTEIQIAATTIDINGAINASGEIIAASLDISGAIDVDGTSNLDVVDIDGAVDMASTLTVAQAINGSLKRWTAKTSAYTAVAGDRLLADTATTAAFTITLPSAPAVGDEIHILDSAANFDNANLTVARNGKKIQGATADLTITTENTGIGLVFMSDTYGWRILVDAYDVDPTEL